MSQSTAYGAGKRLLGELFRCRAACGQRAPQMVRNQHKCGYLRYFAERDSALCIAEQRIVT